MGEENDEEEVEVEEGEGSGNIKDLGVGYCTWLFEGVNKTPVIACNGV